jgi:hypothetical protein
VPLGLLGLPGKLLVVVLMLVMLLVLKRRLRLGTAAELLGLFLCLGTGGFLLAMLM